MAATFTGEGHKSTGDPNLPEGYVTMLAARLYNDADAERFEAHGEAASEWFETDEANGSFDWTITYVDVPDSIHRIVEVYYHFTDPDTAFRFKMRFG